MFLSVAGIIGNKAVKGAWSDEAISLSDLSAYTFPTVDIGAANGRRWMYVFVAWRRDSGTLANIISMTLDGNAMSLVSGPIGVDFDTGGDSRILRSAIYRIKAPAEVSVPVVVTFDQTCTSCQIHAFRAIHAQQAVPVGVTTAGTPAELSINNVETPAGGLVFCVGAVTRDPPSGTPNPFWTNAVEGSVVGAANPVSSGADYVIEGSNTVTLANNNPPDYSSNRHSVQFHVITITP